jgi:hypothetical protein
VRPLSVRIWAAVCWWRGNCSITNSTAFRTLLGEEIAEKTAEDRKAAGLPPDRTALRGISAWLENLARTHPQTMSAMLSRILPTRVETETSVTHTAATYRTYDENTARLRELGLPGERIYPMLEARREPDDDKVH